MPFAMQPVAFPQGGWPEGTDRAPAEGETFPRGTPLRGTGGEVEEHPLGATVVNILGVSLEGATDAESDNPSGTVNYAKAGRNQIFVAKVVNGSGEVQEVDPADVGSTFELRKQGTGRDAWFGVNTAATTNDVVQIVAVDSERHIAYFKFIESAIQEP